MLRGRVEIRRFFNKDRFYIAFTIAVPVMSYKSKNQNVGLDDFEFSVNNKLIDKSKINIREIEYFPGKQGNIDDFFAFKKSNIDFKPNAATLYHVVISSDSLGLKFSELNNIVFQTNGNNKEIWDIKKSTNQVKEYRIESKENKANFKVAERYLFEFGELNNDTIDSKTYYIDTNINFNKITHQNNEEIGVSKSVIKAEKYWNNSDFSIFDEYKRIWNQYQSLSKNELHSFSGEQWQNLNNLNLHSETISTFYNSNSEQKRYVFDWPTEYSYKTNSIQDGYNFDKKGLFIPYNFKGDLTTTYKYIFDNGGFDNNDNLIKIYINNTQNVKNRILDPFDGMISMDVEQDVLEVSELKYSFSANDIETIIKNNPMNIDFFNKFRINNEQEKNNNTNS
ncbi:hypothetical protein NXS15_03490 [Mycoplasma sp. CSL7475-4]|uniref:MHO_1580 family protein n=1 Tax=Mycoplasma sp. CSL7475-4 TaxID=2973942 RepID=UPI00216AF1FA|nr:hypothetical protein [Mycoplasma sp. CSL7475-4]MCS4537176.1 hypothetical protein [Mycoplasma sp. CSL7475-4]